MKTIAEAPGPANRLNGSAPAADARIGRTSLGEAIKMFFIAAIVVVLLVKFKLMSLIKRGPRK